MFKAILIDPPWPHRGGGGRAASCHYQTLTFDQIVTTILSSPVWYPDDAGCHLWLWAVNNYLAEALDLVHTLGFTYLTKVTWTKRRMGIGYWLRGQTEDLLFARRGHPERLTQSATTLLESDMGPFDGTCREHSRKPDEVYGLVEKVSQGPWLEMFARYPREGWYQWGDELPIPLPPGCHRDLTND